MENKINMMQTEIGKLKKEKDELKNKSNIKDGDEMGGEGGGWKGWKSGNEGGWVDDPWMGSKGMAKARKDDDGWVIDALASD